MVSGQFLDLVKVLLFSSAGVYFVGMRGKKFASERGLAPSLQGELLGKREPCGPPRVGRLIFCCNLDRPNLIRVAFSDSPNSTIGFAAD